MPRQLNQHLVVLVTGNHKNYLPRQLLPTASMLCYTTSYTRSRNLGRLWSVVQLLGGGVPMKKSIEIPVFTALKMSKCPTSFRVWLKHAPLPTAFESLMWKWRT